MKKSSEERISELERLLLASAEETRRIFNGLLDAREQLARVKAESLRVVEDGEVALDSIDEEFAFRDSDGDIGFASGGECWLRPNEIVTKLRLERWADAR